MIGPPNVTVQYGDDVSFICTASGWPIPFVTFENEASTIDDPRFIFEISPEDAVTVSGSMNLTYAEVYDTGEYTCQASSLEFEEVEKLSFFIEVFG